MENRQTCKIATTSKSFSCVHSVCATTRKNLHSSPVLRKVISIEKLCRSSTSTVPWRKTTKRETPNPTRCFPKLENPACETQQYTNPGGAGAHSEKTPPPSRVLENSYTKPAFFTSPCSFSSLVLAAEIW